MSVVSTEVSKNNPVTSSDVERTVATLGFSLDKGEIEVHTKLLAAAYDTFEQLSALPEYHLPVDRDLFPRTNIRKIESCDNSFGSAWSYKFSLGGAAAPDNSSRSQQNSPGLLKGKRIVVKDNISVADIPQEYGTDAIEPWVPQSDATVVKRILEAGGQIVGTATCEALSCATVSNTAAAGPVFNPWAHGYSAGGSSSGVAALVAADEVQSASLPEGSHSRQPGAAPEELYRVDMGLGGDQGGSIRVPAAFCGLVGLKPTHGLVPYTGVTACEPVLDHVGPMCKTVMDTALLLEAIAGRDDLDDRQIGSQRHGDVKYSTDLKEWHQRAIATNPKKPLAGRRAAILTEAIDAPLVRDETKEELRKALKQFEDLGVIVDEVSMPWHETGRSLWMAVCRQSLTSVALGNPMGRRGYYPTGFYKSLLPWTQEKWDLLPVAMRNELINGTFQREKFPNLYAKCMNLTIKLTEEYEKLFKVYDVLILPTVPFTAPSLFDRSTASPWEVMSSTFGQTLNTMQFNLTGHPAMSIPTGTAADMSSAGSNIMLPVAAQLVGPLHGESKILEFGYAYETAYDWKLKCN